MALGKIPIECEPLGDVSHSTSQERSLSGRSYCGAELLLPILCRAFGRFRRTLSVPQIGRQVLGATLIVLNRGGPSGAWRRRRRSSRARPKPEGALQCSACPPPEPAPTTPPPAPGPPPPPP